MGGKRIILALACLAGAPALAADVYKWTDDQGQVHYSDQPPLNREAELIAAPGRASPAAATRPAAGPTEAAATETAAEAAGEHCEVARDNLALLEDESIEEFRRDDGDAFRPDADERADLIAEARAQVAYFCRD